MHWARAGAGVFLIFYGTYHAMNGTADAIEDRLVALFWANHRKLQAREKALRG